MSAAITIDLLPSGKPGHVNIRVTSLVSDGTELTQEELIFALEETLEGLRSGKIRRSVANGNE
jgi:hypothetical protein